MSEQPRVDPAAGLALSGIRVAVPATRRANETAALIRRWGGEPIVAPLLQEVPVVDEAPLRAATQAIADAGCTWSIHLTGVGARQWFERASEWGLLDSLLEVLRGAGIIARGQKARAALAERGLAATWVPAGETSAEIAAWLAPQVGPADTVGLQRYGEPVATLTAALNRQGARVIEIAPYQWALPTDPAGREAAERLVRAVAGREVEALVLTSAVQATHLFVISRSLGLEADLRGALTEHVFTAAVGEVARGGLEREGVPVDLVAEPARMGALVRALAGASDRVRTKAAGA